MTTALTPQAASSPPSAGLAPSQPVAKDPAALLYGAPTAEIIPPAAAPSPGAIVPGDPDAGGAPAPDPAAPGVAEAPAGDAPGDGDAISTLAELIEQNQFDPGWFNTLKVDVKVDGETTAVPLSALVKSYQIGEAATKRLDDAKTRAAAMTTEITTQRDVLHGQLSAAATLIKHAEAALEGEVKEIDWAALREKDPAEWSAKKAEVAERRERLKALKDQGSQAFQDAVKAHRANTDAALEQQLVTSRAALKDAIPEWLDKEKAKAEMTQIETYLTTKEGFSVEEIRGTIDHRLLVLARKAWLHDNAQLSDPSKKLVRKMPKMLKPNGAPPPGPSGKSNVDILYKH